MKRALMYASVASMIQQFNMENIRLLLAQGYEVDVACNMEQGSTISSERIAAMKQELENMGVHIFHIPVPRKVTSVGEIFRSLKISIKIMNERRYSLIHCHSPIGGMICRLANRLCKHYKTTKMIYTAHGFHFYKGAPKKNWLMFYPVEWFCSKYTDVLITINEEDRALASEKMRAKEVVYVPGIGVDVKKFADVAVEKGQKRAEIGVPKDSTLLLSVGELNENKNHSTVICALGQLRNDKIHYAIAGLGKLDNELVELARKLGVEKQVHLLGFRTDVKELYQAADIYVHPSYREGLPVSVMEAMAAGRAVICSRIRGNSDLIREGVGGWLLSAEDAAGFAEKIDQLQNNEFLINQMGRANALYIENFSRDRVSALMAKIYQ